MPSLWWSFALTTIGVTGLALVYARPQSVAGPTIGVAVQALWVAYSVATGQWWFLASAFAYGGVSAYGIHTRRRAHATLPRYTCGCVVGGPARCPDATGKNIPTHGLHTLHGTPRPRGVERIRADQQPPASSSAQDCDFD